MATLYWVRYTRPLSADSVEKVENPSTKEFFSEAEE